MDVSENRGTTKSSILIGFSIINHPFWGTPIFGNTHMLVVFQVQSKYDVLRGKVYLTVHWIYFQQCIYIYIYIMA